MKKLACNYAVARFLPYAETGEFVNIGVVLSCPEAGFFGHRLTNRRKRVTNFFQELDAHVYRLGLHHLAEELEAVAAAASTAGPNATAHFRTLIRPRETLFRFSGARTVLTDDPAATLAQLFDEYVHRQFAVEKEYQETLMANHLRQVFSRAELARLYHNETVGTESYSVILPFVHRRGDRVVKAIKPLDLNKETPTKVYEHGDQWITRVRRLRELGKLPDEFLFTVQPPESGTRRIAAGQEIMRELTAMHTTVVPFKEESRVLAFAQVDAAA